MKSLTLMLRILRVSLRALARNKMRTFLTCLGIIIGVGAVIAMVSIGAGAKAAVESRFASMGTNLLFVGPGNRNVGGVRTGFGGWNTLTVEDAEALRSLSAVESISPSVSARAQVVYGTKNWNTSVQGVGESYPDVRKWEIVVRRLLRREPRPLGGQGGRAGGGPGDQPVRRRGPAGPDHPHQAGAVRRHRRPQEQGPVGRVRQPATT